MAFLDDLTSFLGIPSSSGQQSQQPQSGGMTNYGAMPSAQGAGGAPQVLARLATPAQSTQSNPMGLSTPIGGNDLAVAMSGLSQVRPGAGKFSAFAQGLAGAMGARANYDLQNRELAQKSLLTNIEVAKYQQQLEMQRQLMSARMAGANALGGSGGGAPAPSMAPPAPAAAAGAPPAMAPVNLPGANGASPPSPAPAAGAGAAPPPQMPSPAAAGAGQPPAPPQSPPNAGAGPSPTPQMIPHQVAAQPEFWSSVAPDSNPAYLDRQAQQYEDAARASALDPETSKRYGDTANQYRQRAFQIRSNGMVTLNDGSQALIPGFAASKATAAAATKAAEANVEDQHQLVNVQPTPGGPTVMVPKSAVLANAQSPGNPNAGNGSPPGGALPMGINIASQPAFINQRIDQMWKDQDAMTQQYHARQDAMGRLQQMQGILSQYQSGSFADKKAEALANLKAVTGIDLDPAQVQNYQEFQKLATKQVFNDVKSMGGRVLVSEIEGLTRANANPNLSPGANQAILGSAIGALNRENQYYSDFTKWHNSNPMAYDASGFEQDWNKNNPAIAYSEQGIKDTPAKGVAIPAAADRVDGQMYVTPKGPARWVAGKGWQLQGGQ